MAVYAALVFFARGQRTMGFLAKLGCGLMLAQIAVGVANVLFRLPIALTALHSGLAAAMVLVTAMLVREALGARSAPVEVNPEPRMVEAQ
jgi:heme A synthase